MNFPADLWTITLLLVAIAIILLVATEIISSYHGKVSILINKKRLKNAAIGATITTIITAVILLISLTNNITL